MVAQKLIGKAAKKGTEKLIVQLLKNKLWQDLGKEKTSKIVPNLTNEIFYAHDNPPATTLKEAVLLKDKDFITTSNLVEGAKRNNPALFQEDINITESKKSLNQLIPGYGSPYPTGQDVGMPWNTFNVWVDEVTPKLKHLKHNLKSNDNWEEYRTVVRNESLKFADKKMPYSNYTIKNYDDAADNLRNQSVFSQTKGFSESGAMAIPNHKTYGGMWGNYLIDKVPTFFPPKMPTTSNNLVITLNKLKDQRDNLIRDDLKLQQMMNMTPNSRVHTLTPLNQLKEQGWSETSYKESFRKLKDMGQDNYQGPKIWRNEAIKTEADYYKTQDWINKIEAQLEQISPAVKVGQTWIGKKTPEQNFEITTSKFITSLKDLTSKHPQYISHMNKIRNSSPQNKAKFDYAIAQNLDREIQRVEKVHAGPDMWQYNIYWKWNLGQQDIKGRHSTSSFSVAKTAEEKRKLSPLNWLSQAVQKKELFGLPAKSPEFKAMFENLRPLLQENILGREKLGPLVGDPKWRLSQEEAVENYIAGWKKLFEQKQEIMETGDLVKGLRDVYRYYSKEGKDARGIVDFAHLFEIAATGKVAPNSPLLKIAGSPDVVQLQPRIVNTIIARAVESKIRDLRKNLPLTTPGTEYHMKLNKLSNILKKLKTTSIITDPSGIQTVFGSPLASPLKANRLTKGDFYDLLNILSSKEMQNITKYLTSGIKAKDLDLTKFNKGGAVDYGEMKPVVPPLDPGERQYLQLGGKAAEAAAKAAAKAGVKYIKRQVLPKVIGHTTKIMDKITGPDLSRVRTDLYTPPKGPYTITDDSGVAVLDKQYKTLDEAQAALKALSELRTQDASSFKIFGARPPKTAEGVSEGAPEVEIGQLGKVVTEETPAMVWKAPEIIKNAPMEIAQGKQWLGILKKAGVSPKELDDTSLAPFLEIHEPNTKFTKKQLLEQFDDLAPKIEVLATGKRDQGKYLQNILTKFKSVRDNIAYTGPEHGKMIAVMNNFAGILEKVQGANTDKKLNVLANQINKIMKQAYDIDNALMSDQIPAIRQIPAPIRSIFGDMQELFKTRGAAHAFNKKPSHAGDQVLPGGVNYREYLFKYTPNQFRGDEPRYTPGHSFDFSDDLAQNTFVHARISDRTDNFGRKILFVEEIQSDMHQRPQKAIREGRPSGYAKREDKILGAEPLIKELNALQTKIDAILAREPNHSSLPTLYKKRGTLADKIEKIKSESGGGGDIPEGPFQRSEDYGSFVIKYLLRLSKEGNYDGVAVSTGSIKNRKGYGSEEETKGHYGFYDKIMQKVMKKIAKNADLEYNRTVINDGAVNWGNVPILILKEIDKVMKGLPSYREGGLNRENFVDVVPLL